MNAVLVVTEERGQIQRGHQSVREGIKLREEHVIIATFLSFIIIYKGNVEERPIKKQDTEISFGHNGDEKLSSKAQERDYSHGSIFGKE